MRSHDCVEYLKELVASLYKENKELKNDLGKAKIRELNWSAKAICEKLKAEKAGEKGIKKAIAENQPLIKRIQEICISREIQCLDEKNPVFEKIIKIQSILDKEFGAAKLNRKDNFSPWHFVSVSLFGDYSACEALGLLAAATLINFEKELIKEYSVCFEERLKGCIGLFCGFRTFDFVALSLAIRRPFYFYDIFDDFEKKFNSKQNKSMSTLYNEAKTVFEQNEFSGHYRFVGFEEDDNGKEPICILFLRFGPDHIILPKDAENRVSPWKPKKLQNKYFTPKNVTNN